MNRRNFLVDLLLWILAFFFGYTIKREGENLNLFKTDPRIVLDQDGNNIVDKIRVLSQRFNYVTPEMFGAVGDGIADDTQAIIDADKYARENDIKLLGRQTYLLSSQWDVQARIADFSESTILLANNFPNDVAILTNRYSTTQIFDYKFTIDGNRNNQTIKITALKVLSLAVPNFEITVKVQNCFNAVMVQGNTEKGRIDISAINTDRILIEKASTDGTDSTPDEMIYSISNGKNCKQFYYKETLSASMVTFNTEGSSADETYKYLVDINAGAKPTQLLGLIRTPSIKTIRVRNGSICQFGGLVIFYPYKLAVDVVNARTLSGNINIEFAQSSGAWIRKIQLASKLDIKVSNFKGKYAVKLGDSATSSVINNSTISLHTSIIRGDCNFLIIQGARKSLINLNYTGSKPATGGVVLEDKNYNFTLNLDSGFMENNIPVTVSGTLAYDINFVGGASYKDKILNYSTPIRGMKTHLINNGRLVTYDGYNWNIITDTVL